MNLKKSQRKLSRLKHREEKESEKNEKSFSDLWNKIKWSNVYKMGVPEEGGQKCYLKK